MGYSTAPEAGRIIVKEQIESNGENLPWINPMGFCNLLIEKSIEFYKSALNIEHAKANVIFFDRSFLDTISYYQAYAEKNIHLYNNFITQFRFDNPVLMTPPWESIFSEDTERKHNFKSAVSEYDRLKCFYPNQGYKIVDIPKMTINKRIEFIL